MKFLCVVCDQQMKLQRTVGPDRGSITLIYSCPECGYPVAMMTNPHETQVVSSLGVTVGVGEEGAAASSASKCPLTGMLQGVEGKGEKAQNQEHDIQDDVDQDPDAVRWTEAAQRRMGALPESIRAMAVTGIEKYARDHGHREIDEGLLDQARSHFGV